MCWPIQPWSLFNSSGTVIQSNDNWQTGPNAAEINAVGLAPTNPLESAMLASFAAGIYPPFCREGAATAWTCGWWKSTIT